MRDQLRRFIIKLFPAKKKNEEIIFFTKDYFKDKNYNIGDYTYGRPLVIFENEDATLTIGKFCSISDGVTIFLGGNHRTDWISTYPFNVLNDLFPEAKHIKGHPATKGDVVIGNDVWIGRNVTIMSGIKIDDGSVIGSGSVLTKNVGKYEIWAGNPARLIKKRFDDELVNKLDRLSWWDWDIERITKNVDILCSTNYNKLDEF